MANPTVTNVDGTNTGPVVVTSPSPYMNQGGPQQIGAYASALVSFYGATPVVQRATAASHTTIATTVAVSTTSSVATGWGFSTSTQANALTAAVAEIQATLVAIGIWAA